MTYKVAIAGLSHDHVWAEVPHWLSHPSVDIIAVCDSDKSLTQRADELWGIESAYPSWDELIANNYPDICLFFGSNRVAADGAIKALKQQIHVMIEKPLSADREQALALHTAAKASQAELMVNWPEWWYPSYQIAEAMMMREAIGTIQSVRVRMGHRGPRNIGCSEAFCRWLYDENLNGSGAAHDYGCYGVAAALHMIGRPLSVSADFLQFSGDSVEREACITLASDHGLSQIAASWQQEPPLREHAFFGSSGTVWLDREDLWVQTAESEKIKLQPTPNDVPYANSAQFFINSLDKRKTIDGIFGIDLNVDVMCVLEAAKNAARTGTRIEPTWES
jgi:predicted dehydrogenase